MATTLTPEEKAQLQKGLLLGVATGITIGSIIWSLVMRKATDKLEAKIMKLEGWQ